MKLQNIIRPNALLGASLCALALLVVAPRAAAQANANPPNLLTYQGYLVDGNGVALATNAPKNYDVIFRIWDVASGGATPLWAEQQTVTVDKGYFSVLLGEGSSIGQPRPALNTIFTNNTASDRWVGITVKGIGGGGTDVDILPRLRLLTAPYAFLAQKAFNAATVDGAGLISGTVPDARLSGNVALRGGGNTFTGTQIINGSVGINKSPGTTLDISGGFNVGNANGSFGYFGFPGAGTTLLAGFTGANNNGPQLRFNGAGGGFVDIGQNSTGDFVIEQSDAARLTVTTAGNVSAANSLGIGTATPGARLHIVDNTIPSARIESSSTVGTWMALGNTSVGGRYWHLISTGSGNGGGAGKLLVTAGIIPNATDANPMTFQSDGKVGINTVSPQTPLHVVGVNQSQLRVQNSANNTFWDIFSESSPNSGHLLFNPSAGTGSFINRNNGSYNVNSDVRLKTDVTALGSVLDRVLKLRSVSYRYTSTPDAAKTLGFIAQEVEPLFPELVSEANGFKGLAYAEFAPVAVGAIQEINQKLESQLRDKDRELKTLQTRLAELETRQKNDDARLAELEKLLRKQLGANQSADKLDSVSAPGN
jgi:hypothetical protein